MKSAFLITFLLLNIFSFSQSINPGGIHGCLFWYIADKVNNKPAYRNNLLPGNYLMPGEAGINVSSLNYHSSIVFNHIIDLSFSIPDSLINKGSFFTVYACSDTLHENILWQISSNEGTSLVSTTDRLADLSLYRYMNFFDIGRALPKLNIYEHQRDTFLTGTGNKMYIGSKPVTPNLPVFDFNGSIPEFLTFGRVLNSEERLKVASYLSLKYGITLAEPGGIYLNSTGDILWNGSLYTTYHHNIAGLVRDDSSGLIQQLASSSNYPGLLTVSGSDSITNNSSLIWGDNDQPFAKQDSSDGLEIYKKNWLFVPHNWHADKTVSITVDTKKIDDYILPGDNLWAVTDRSGDGTFLFDNTDYTRMNMMDKNGIASFNSFKLSGDENKNFNLGFLKGGKLLIVKNILNPKCTPLAEGSISVKAYADKYPVSVQLLNRTTGSHTTYISENSEPYTFSNIDPGYYLLSADDVSGNHYLDSFIVNNVDAPHPQGIQSSYTLHDDERITLNAKQGTAEGANYLWKGPDNFISTNSSVTVANEGMYLLTCTNDNCAYYQEINITKALSSPFKEILVYPNPSSEYFTAKVSLDKPAGLEVSVYTNDGKLVIKKQLNGMANYTINDHLLINGIYHIVFASGGFTESRKLMIEK